MTDIKNMDNDELLSRFAAKVRENIQHADKGMQNGAAFEAMAFHSEILSRMQGWVSVDERLPDKNHVVLVWDGYVYSLAMCDGDEWTIYTDPPRPVEDKILLWAQLPTPPEDASLWLLPLPQPPKDAK